MAESLQRGMRVIVLRPAAAADYETKEGEKRTVYEVEVDDVGPSLRNASAKVNRIAASAGTAGTAAAASGARVARRPVLRRPAGPGRLRRRGRRGRGVDPWATDSAGGYSDEPPF